MLEYLWGLKTTAWFDWWSIEHILSGVSAGSAVDIHHQKKQISCPKLKQHFDVYAVLLLAYMWEVVEHYLETGVLSGFEGGGSRELASGRRIFWKPIYNRPVIGSFRIFYSNSISSICNTCKNFIYSLASRTYLPISSFNVPS